MKRWFIGYNDYWYTAGIHLEETPMILCFLEWVVDWVSVIIPPINLPRIKFRLKNKDNWDWTEHKDGRTTLRDWYGDFRQVYDVFIWNPVFDFTLKHTKHHYFEYPYGILEKEFPEVFEEMLSKDEDAQERAKHREASELIEKDFSIILKRLQDIDP